MKDQHAVSPTTFVHILYLLFVLGSFFLLPWIVAIVLNYIKADEMTGSWLHTHYVYQSQTFWKSLIWYLIGLALCLIAVGVIVIFFVYFWYLYRMIKGWIYLSDGLPMRNF